MSAKSSGAGAGRRRESPRRSGLASHDRRRWRLLFAVFRAFILLARLSLLCPVALRTIRELLIDLASEFGPYTFFCHGGVNSFLLFVYERRARLISPRGIRYIRENPRETSVGSGLLMLSFNLCTGGDGETYFAAFALLNLLVSLETFLEATAWRWFPSRRLCISFFPQVLTSPCDVEVPPLPLQRRSSSEQP